VLRYSAASKGSRRLWQHPNSHSRAAMSFSISKKLTALDGAASFKRAWWCEVIGKSEHFRCVRQAAE
jgi:hypothetical protein